MCRSAVGGIDANHFASFGDIRAIASSWWGYFVFCCCMLVCCRDEMKVEPVWTRDLALTAVRLPTVLNSWQMFCGCGLGSIVRVFSFVWLILFVFVFRLFFVYFSPCNSALHPAREKKMLICDHRYIISWVGCSVVLRVGQVNCSVLKSHL